MKIFFLIFYILFLIRGLFQLLDGSSWTLSWFSVLISVLGLFALTKKIHEKYLSGFLVMLLFIFMMSH